MTMTTKKPVNNPVTTKIKIIDYFYLKTGIEIMNPFSSQLKIEKDVYSAYLINHK